MNIQQNSSKSDIPSHYSKKLHTLIGHRITGATRYSWWPAEETEQECGVKGEDTFSLTAGPVALEFDTGVILGIASDPSVNSVCVWIEKDDHGKLLRKELLESDADLYPISAGDLTFASNFWRSVIGSQVNAVSILVRRPSSALFAELPNEVGLCFSLDSGLKIAAVHGLHDDSDDFAIISSQAILSKLHAELQEVFLSE
jgi:hypothetical protein